MINIKKAALEDFANFNIHKTNLEEINTFTDIEPDVCMAYLWDFSQEKIIVTIDDNPVCLFGILPSHNMWLFFNEGIDYLPLTFFKKTRKELNLLVDKYGEIESNILSKNIFAIKWAKFIGFKFEKEYFINNKKIHKLINRRG